MGWAGGRSSARATGRGLYGQGSTTAGYSYSRGGSVGLEHGSPWLESGRPGTGTSRSLLDLGRPVSSRICRGLGVQEGHGTGWQDRRASAVGSDQLPLSGSPATQALEDPGSGASSPWSLAGDPATAPAAIGAVASGVGWAQDRQARVIVGYIGGRGGRDLPRSVEAYGLGTPEGVAVGLGAVDRCACSYVLSRVVLRLGHRAPSSRPSRHR